MKLMYATLLLLAPTVCAAQCKNAVTVLKVKIDASESDKPQLLRMLGKHGCDHRIGFETADEGFDYIIAIGRSLEATSYFNLGQREVIGTYYKSVVEITVFDGKGNRLFIFTRGNRLTRNGMINAEAKEITKRLSRLRTHH